MSRDEVKIRRARTFVMERFGAVIALDDVVDVGHGGAHEEREDECGNVVATILDHRTQNISAHDRSGRYENDPPRG